MKLKHIVAVLLVLGLFAAACEGTGVVESAQSREQAVTETYQKRLAEARPYPVAEMRDSLERANLTERLLRFNDASKIGYVYLLSDFGTVVSYFTIKGKISSVNSALTVTQNIIWSCRVNHGCQPSVVEGPGDDGSYGPNEGGDSGVFFFTTEGVLVEWAGQFLYSDYPLELTEEPILVYDADKAAPSSTSEDLGE